MQVRATREASQAQVEAQEANIALIRQAEQTAIGTRELADATGALVGETRRLVRSTIWVAVFTAVAAVAAGTAAIVAAVN
jgi:hypothetical protein